MPPRIAGDVKTEIPVEVVARLRAAERVTVLTGAGVSAESGIPTFRGAGGVWEKYDFTRLATPEGFREDPRLVWEWYQQRQIEISKAKPNPAHLTIADMEKRYPSFTVVTQNIDGMHRRAGNRNVVELHGNIWRMRCPRDNTLVDLDSPVSEIPPLCQCGSIMRPDVVWFGEPLPHDALEAASRAAAESDAMLVVGTSAVVYPAAALPVIAKNSGSLVVEVNVEPTDVTGYADLLLQGRAGEVLPALWTMILEPERFMTEHPVLPNR